MDKLHFFIIDGALALKIDYVKNMEKEEINFFKKIKNLIENYSPNKYSIVLTLPILAMICGFLIWNFYLFTLGFLEEELLRAKFILSGALFGIITFIIYSTLYSIYRSAISLYIWLWIKLKNISWIVKILSYLPQAFFSRLLECVKIYLRFKKIQDYVAFCRFCILSFLFLIYFVGYVIYVFPIVPAIIGGGQPRSLSLLMTSSNIQILNSLGIPVGDGAVYQTENICVAHENSNSVYVLRSDRILVIDRSLIQGFGSLPGQKSIYEYACIKGAQKWSIRGFQSSLQLFVVSIQDVFGKIFSNQPS
ncbi:MAG: hypothetical protein AAB378_02790 [Patescibacteria group bacterium]